MQNLPIDTLLVSLIIRVRLDIHVVRTSDRGLPILQYRHPVYRTALQTAGKRANGQTKHGKYEDLLSV